MDTIINLGKSQTERLSRVLSRYLSRTSRGKQVISEIGKNREQGWEALFAYLNARLPEDKALKNQIREALGEEHGKQFNTIVANGGSVGEIFNIGQLDSLNIHYSLFSDVRQVVAFLSGIVIILGAVALVGWWISQPKRMTGDFNIAVAKFIEQTDSPDAHNANRVSEIIFDYLSAESQLVTYENVQVARKNIGEISEPREAEKLAETIRADVVIYGSVLTSGDSVWVSPQFYVAQSFRADVGEINGQGEHQLGRPIEIPVAALHPGSPESADLKQRMAILVAFTKSLAYLGLDDLDLARVAIEEAIVHTQEYGNLSGSQVLYLFASHISRLQRNLQQALQSATKALDLDPSYGRAYIARANIHFVQFDYLSALEDYTKAAQMQNQPYGAYVAEKANLGLGNIYYYQYRTAKLNPLALESELADLAKLALEHYGMVTGSYSPERPDPRQAELAGWSYLYTGIIYQEQNQLPLARQAFEQVLALTQDPQLEQEARKQLDTLKEVL